ncbi:MAG: 16S rRNA (adenine(1518)-N(6)/adenine(1519)-N(6))-dimethyltransferase RsmA [Actinomycetota bacterium]
MSRVTPSIAADLLRRYGLRAGRRHGQHFLVDPNTVERIVRLAEVSSDETILEVGPGLGSLTVALAEAARRVVAVELDATVAEALDEVLGGASNVEVTTGDAMRIDLSALMNERARLIANLPYNVATPLMLRVLDEVPQIAGGLVMVQKEIGERWTAKTSTRAYNAVTLHIGFHAEAEIIGDVPKSVFMPPPRVASVLVRFTRRTHPAVKVRDDKDFLAFVGKAFAHRRKTLRNSLMAGGFDRELVERSLDPIGIDDRTRPEELGLEEFAGVFEAMSK